MKVVKLTVGSLKENCYLIYNENSNCVIIDPGDESEYISSKIQECKLKPEAIFLTHGHFDHVMAAEELRLIYKVPIIMHKDDLFLIERLKETAKHFLDRGDVLKPTIDKLLEDESSIDLIDDSFGIIKTPGHTPGSVSLYSKKLGEVFVGDLMFAGGGIGRYDFSYCNKHDLYSSIEMILSLPAETTIYSGHGKSSTVKEERKYHKTP